jgi:hypothetical protein
MVLECMQGTCNLLYIDGMSRAALTHESRCKSDVEWWNYLIEYPAADGGPEISHIFKVLTAMRE